MRHIDFLLTFVKRASNQRQLFTIWYDETLRVCFASSLKVYKADGLSRIPHGIPGVMAEQ
jgi:hypothetical protein